MTNFDLLFFLSYLILLGIIYSKLIRFTLNEKENKRDKWLNIVAYTVILFFFILMTFPPYEGEDFDIILITVLTLVISISAYNYVKITDITQKFQSIRSESSYSFITENNFKEVVNSDRHLIPTYPRVSIHELSPDESEKDMIFDSSDISILHEALNLENFDYQSLYQGEKFNLKGKQYIAKEVRIDILNFYDDYSKYGTNSIHQGKETPYNIQIIVKAKKL